MLTKILEHRLTLIISSAVLAIVVIIGGFYLLRPVPRVLSATPAQMRPIRNAVTTNGSVDSDKHVTLSFRAGGIVSAVNVGVGDQVTAGEVLASLDAGALQASLQGAQADVLSAEAGVSTLEKGATPETRAVYTQGVATARASLQTAVPDSFLKIQDALLNKIAPLFNNNASPNPTITIPTDSPDLMLSLDAARANMTSLITAWNADVTADPTSAASLSDGTSAIAAATSFMDSLSAAVNRLSPSNSGLTQTQISAYVTDVNGASSETNAAQTEFNAARNAYQTAADQLTLISASSTPEALQSAQAAVAKARSAEASIQSQLDDSLVIAPWDGTVASVVPKAGDNIAADAPVIDVVSAGAYKIDALIPQNEIGEVAVGYMAEISFEASGAGLTATGTVAAVDLAPTVTNGVSAYKATIIIGDSDPKIRTGMTGDITIYGPASASVLSVPTSSVFANASGDYVLVLNGTKSYSERPVVTGVSGGGWTEIVSGLSAGESVASFGSDASAPAGL